MGSRGLHRGQVEALAQGAVERHLARVGVWVDDGRADAGGARGGGRVLAAGSAGVAERVPVGGRRGPGSRVCLRLWPGFMRLPRLGIRGPAAPAEVPPTDRAARSCLSPSHHIARDPASPEELALDLPSRGRAKIVDLAIRGVVGRSLVLPADVWGCGRRQGRRGKHVTFWRVHALARATLVHAWHASVRARVRKCQSARGLRSPSRPLSVK